MASKFAGLFGGDSPGDIRSLMEQENQGRVRQAFLDQTKAGGGPLAANAARYREQGLQGLDRMLGAGASMMGMEIPQDPRMVRASKREKDKTEILGILEGYRLSDGKMTADEVQKGWSLLISKGYQKEAEEFRNMYKTLQDDSNLSYKKKVLTQRELEFQLDKKNIVKSTKEVGDFQDSQGKLFSKFLNVYKDGTTGSVLVPQGDDNDKPVGRISPADESGMTSADRVKESDQIYTRKAILSRKTSKYQEKLKRVTAELQQGLDIGKDKAKMYADWAITSQKETLKASNVAQRSIRKVEDMLTYIRELKATGTKQGAITAALNKVGRAFGIEAKDKGRFRTKARLILIADLTKLMGARPTDTDLKKMEEAYPGEEQPVETNEAILEEILSRYREEIFAGSFYRKNPKGTPMDFSRAVRERFTKMGSYNTPLTVPDGEDFDEWYEGLPRGAVVKAPSGRIAGRK